MQHALADAHTYSLLHIADLRRPSSSAQPSTTTLPLVDDAYATHMCDLVPCRPKTNALTCSPLFEDAFGATTEAYDWGNVGVLRGREIALPLLPAMLLHPVRSVWREAGKVGALALGGL